MKCSCEQFKSNGYCIHSHYFNQNGYGQYIDPNQENSSNNELEPPIEYYVITSTYDSSIFYLLNKDFTTCTCKSYIYSNINPKTCKHIQKYINYDNVELLPIFCPQTGKCSCSTDSYCQHTEYFI